MIAPVGQRRSFGRRKQPITFVIARGENVRHITLDARQALRGGILAGLVGILLSGLAYTGLSNSEGSSVPTEHALRQSYETRLATLRTQLDEATSRQFVAQKMVESKVDVLLTQQEIIAERYDRLEPIFERARENGILRELMTSDAPLPTPRPQDRATDPFDALERAAHFKADITGTNVAETVSETLRDQTVVQRAENNYLDPIQTASLRETTNDLSQEALHGFGRAIDYAELQQIANLKVLTSEAIERSTRIASVLTSVGIKAELEPQSALGGPFEPAPQDAGFETHYEELENALDSLEGLRGLSEALPFVAPMASKLMSSRFGIRSDPFLRRRALHAGIDYAARSGTPIKATANGTVVRASRAGGYGNLVEIDHGNGLKTRFGHMARIDVKVGDRIERGDRLGAVGSTGRSTGPHLHYEIRRHGKAIDPMRFIRAGQKIERLS